MAAGHISDSGILTIDHFAVMTPTLPLPNGDFQIGRPRNLRKAAMIETFY
jgi:hypothetical protein